MTARENGSKQLEKKMVSSVTHPKVSPDSHFGSFYSQNLVPDPQNLGARVLSDAYMINQKLYLFIYGFIF